MKQIKDLITPPFILSEKEVKGTSLIEKAFEEVNSVDLRALQREGIELNPRKWDFVHYYPPLGSLPLIKSDGIEFLRETINQPLALYFHIPFCTGLCIYCYYMKYEKSAKELVDKYLNYLRQEVLLIPEKVRAQKIHSIMIGGGTPTFLDEKQLIYLFNIIKDSFGMDTNTTNIEISLEASPETITIEKLQLLKELGVNRLSIGIQSFNDSILRKINRRHSSGEALASIYKIQKAGFDNYNVDLIYGLPWQEIKQVYNDLEFINQIKPPSISYYQLWFSPEKPFGPYLPIDFVPKYYFPDLKKILAMKIMIREYMYTLGYYQDQICWFIKSEKERCKQQVFRWKNNPYLGFGLSSYGYYNGWAYCNYEDLKDYFKSIDEGVLPIKKGKRLTQKEEITRAFVLGLKLTEGVDVNNLQARYRDNVLPVLQEKQEKLHILKEMGLLSVSDLRVVFTEKGKLFDDEICRLFF